MIATLEYKMLASSLSHSVAQYLPVSSRSKASANREEPLFTLWGALLSFFSWRTSISSARVLSRASSIGVFPSYSDKWMHLYVPRNLETLPHIKPLQASRKEGASTAFCRACIAGRTAPAIYCYLVSFKRTPLQHDSTS